MKLCGKKYGHIELVVCISRAHIRWSLSIELRNVSY